MTDDPVCKRAECAHPLSAHNLSRAEKRAKLERTQVLNDFPSPPDPRDFNIQAGRSNTSCSEDGCDCLAFISPYA
jgi:hypothetical protein